MGVRWNVHCGKRRRPVVSRDAVCVGLAYLTVLFGEFGGSQFMYFQF
jgi:hypothetical protein